MRRVLLSLVVLEHLHLFLVRLGHPSELLHSLIDAKQNLISSGRHEVRHAGKNEHATRDGNGLDRGQGCGGTGTVYGAEKTSGRASEGFRRR